MMPERNEFLELIERAEGEDLSDADAARLEALLDSDAACREEADAAALELRDLAGPAADPNADEWDGMLGRIRIAVDLDAAMAGEPSPGDAADAPAAPDRVGELVGLLDAADGHDLYPKDEARLEALLEQSPACRLFADTLSADLRAAVIGWEPAPEVEEPTDEEWRKVFGRVMVGVALTQPVIGIVPGSFGPTVAPGRTRPLIAAKPPSRTSGWIAAAASIAVAAGLLLAVALSGPRNHSGIRAAPLAQGENARVDFLETADDVVAVTMLPTEEDEVLVIFIEDEGGEPR